MVAKPAPTAVYRKAICDLIEQAQAKRVVEVGIYAGGLSKMIAELSCVEELYCIDPWFAEFKGLGKKHMDKLHQDVLNWSHIHKGKVTVRRLTSVQGSNLFYQESIDFFETDGSHRHDMVVADILAWLPKVKDGGILCGDNYEYPDVSRAVDELLPGHELLANGRVWWIRK